MSRSNKMLNIAERTAQPGLIRGPVNLAYAFVERQTNLWKRYWAWELVWLVYGVVNTLAITFIAKEAEQAGITTDASHLVLFLLLGTLVWAYLSAGLGGIKLVITLGGGGRSNRDPPNAAGFRGGGPACQSVFRGPHTS